MKKCAWWILIIAFTFVVAGLFYIYDSSVECCLCNSTPLHAPVLVNLSTGEMLELAVYDADPFCPGELAEEQQTGYFTFVKGAGTSGYREGGKYVKVTIPPANARANNRHFCKNCRDQLSDCNGYAVVDLLAPSDLSIYPITAGMVDLRCYTISIVAKDLQYEITVIGSI